jgi:hypothetical protein
MATEQAQTEGAVLAVGATMEPGTYIVGVYAGIKPSAQYGPFDDGRTVTSKPKIGIRLGDAVLPIQTGSEEEAFRAMAGFEPGATVAVRVVVRPPYGATGKLKITLAGGAPGDDGW